MPGFGAKLRRERENRGFTLDQIAEATRINLRYLRALEAEDFSKLPGSVFNKGYVRAYATFIGADPENLIEAYVVEEQAQEETGQISQPDVPRGLAEAVERKRPRRSAPGGKVWKKAALVLASVGLLVLAGWAFTRIVQPSSGVSDGTAAMSPERIDSEAPPPTEPRTEQPPVAEQIPAGVDRQPEDSSLAEPVGDDASSEPSQPPVERRPPEPATESPPPEPASTETATESRLKVSEFGVGTGVVNRRLVGESDRFEQGTPVWFWTRVVGGEQGVPIRHVWVHEGRPVASTELTLGGAHWRTQSRKTLTAGSLGRWAAEARDAQGHVLARSEFVCVPSGSETTPQNR
jgi:cytoskeleton protein RodZ